MKMPITLQLAAILGVLSTITLRADVVTQGFEDFATTTVPTNITVNGWTINETSIRSSFAPNLTPRSGSRFALFHDSVTSGASGTNGYVQTPWLTNGVGSVTFSLCNRAGATYTGPWVCELRSTTNDIDWVTLETITNASTNWTQYTFAINRYEPVRLRFFRPQNGANSSHMAIDDISTTDAPANLNISGQAISPASPLAGDAVTVSALLTPIGLVSSINATLYWSANGGASNTISMATNTMSGGRYETITPITNQPAFTVVNYTVMVTFSGPSAQSPQTVSGRFFFRQAPPQSAYGSVTVRGDLTNALTLVEDGYWTAALGVVARGTTDLYFESVGGTTNQWRDPAPSRTALPLFGDITAGAADNIRIDSIDAGSLLLSFDETEGSYGIEQAAYQSFNDWSTASTFGNYTNNGWILTQGRVTNTTALAFDGRYVQFASNTAERAIAAPPLTNGIGFIQFHYRNTETNGLNPASFAIQTRASTTNSWSTQATVTNIISPDYVFYRLPINRFEWKYARVVATGPATGQLLLDNLAVSTLEYPADVTIVSHGISPAAPRSDESVTFFAQVDATAPTTSTNATLQMVIDGIPQSPLALAYNAGAGRFETTLPTNLPALVTINYTLQVSFTGPHAAILSPKTATGNFYLRAPLPQSPYSGVSVAGDLVAPLDLATDNYWAGVVAVGAETDLDVYFNSVNGTTTNRWSDPAPYPLRTLPVFGALATNVAADIRIASTTPGWLLMTFDENIGRYGSQQADYQSFNDWSGAGSFTNHTIDGWTLTQGSTTTNAALVFRQRSIQFAATTSERAIEAPSLTNGIGTIAFRYRNTETTLLSPAAFAIQTRAATNAPWTTVETVTGIISPDYTYHSFTVARLDLRYIRIVATDGTAAAQLLIDDIVITRPGATLAFSGLALTPPSPTITNEVNVTVNISALNGAGLNTNTITLSFRGGTNGIYDSITMTNTTGDTYTATIPRGALGLMQYYVEATYLNPATGGYQSTDEPTDRTGSPAAYTNSDVALATQGFEGFATTTVPTNITVNGWTINETSIRSSFSPNLTPRSGSRFALFHDSLTSGASGTNGYVQTPWLTNGVGSVTFYLCNRAGVSYTGPWECELRMSTNDMDWITVNTTTNASTNWTAHTFSVGVYTPVKLRFLRPSDGNNGSHLAIDDISITYPPAYVTVGDFELHPAYPSQEEPNSVACTIESATVYHPAFNITGRLWYRSNNGVSGWTSWNSVAMDHSGSRFSGEIPAMLYPTEVEYYVEADFKGYSAAGEDRSPMTFPESPLGYTLRRYISDYDRMSIRIGTNEITDFEQLSNGLWEGVITFTTATTNHPAFGIDAYGYYDGTIPDSGFTATWGDNNQFRTNLPLAGTATIGALPIIIPEYALGQYIIRFNENTGSYSVQRAAFQDFENWPADDTLFGESYAAATLTQHTNSFETWEPSNPNLSTARFEFAEGWTNASAYPTNWVIDPDGKTSPANHKYVIEDAIVVTQLVGQAALLNTLVGEVRIQDLFPGDTGTFAFDLRCASPNDFRPAIYNSLTPTNIMVTARIRANDIPTNSAMNSVGYAYTSIIGAYSDPSNYYELRIVQTNASNGRLEMWQKSGGSLALRGTPFTLGKSITSDETVSLMMMREGPQWRLKAFHGATERITATSTVLLPGSGIGFGGMDASTSVDWIKVYSITNATYNNATNMIYSEDFTNSPPAGWDGSSGAWTVSGERYTRKGYTGTPLTARVDYSTNLVNWTTINEFTSLSHSDYRRYTTSPHIATNVYVRLRNLSGSGYMIVDNVERVAWRGKTVSTNGWFATNVWVDAIGKTGRGIEMRHSRALGGADQAILSPPLADGASVISLDYKPAPDATGAVAFAIEYEDRDFPGFWYPATTVTNSSNPTNWVHFSYSIADRDLRPEISRMQIRNLTPGHDDGLRLDNITVTEPVPINDTTWWGYNVLVTSLKPAGIYTNATTPWLARLADNTFGAFINNSITNGTGGVTNNEYAPFIQSAYLPDGIGEIRFLYRAWDTNSSTIQVIASTNRLTPENDWVVLDSVSVTNTAFSEYYSAIFERGYTYVGLRVNSLFGNLGRVGVENILITAPLAADLRMTNIRTVPAVPLSSDDVYVWVDVDDLFFSPSGIELQLLHKTGTNIWGNHSSSIVYDMDVMQDNGTSFVFRSRFPIQAKAIDQVVQYQVKASFGGFFAEKSSPKYYRGFVNPPHYWPIDLNRGQTNQTPYYYSFSCLPGQVWINELNVADDQFFLSPAGPQFVEVAGVGNSRVGNWRIEVINPDFSTNSSYTIPGGTTIGSASAAYGFYLLGDGTVTNRNLTLTNALPESAGIQLVRSMGAFEDQVCYDVDTVSEPRPGAAMTNLIHNQRYVYAGVEQTLFVSYSLSLAGSGSNSTGFAWSSTGDFNTIGSTNTDQTLIPWPTNGPVVPGEYTGTAVIESAWRSTGLVYFDVSTQATNLVPTVWYATNLMNIAWQPATNGFNWSRSNTTYRAWCNQVPPPAFYTIKVNVAP